jgi:hypothetical protein
VGGNATANRGGGGGGGACPGTAPLTYSLAGSGGSGVVIIRYTLNPVPDSTTSGTVARTTSGTDVIYTFTGAGTISIPEY